MHSTANLPPVLDSRRIIFQKKKTCMYLRTATIQLSSTANFQLSGDIKFSESIVQFREIVQLATEGKKRTWREKDFCFML